MPPRDAYSGAHFAKIFLKPWNNAGRRRKKRGPLARPCVHKVEDSRRR